MGNFLGGFIAGGVIVGVTQYFIARAMARGQLIRDDKDKKKFIEVFEELAEAFLDEEELAEAFWRRFSVLFFGKK